MPKARTVRSLSRSSPYGRPSVEDHRKEWEEVRCPICMEHPHNAVLLKCSSHDKGCRPYVCDTSRRHSNCLDQFLKTGDSSSSSPGPAWAPGPCGSRGEPGPACPLCRGSILGYSASGPARARLDSEPRSCSTEGCGFSGSYPELRRHARSDHPSARPAEVDPARRLDWARLERESDIRDVLSLVQTSRLLRDGSDDEEDEDEGDDLGLVSPRRQPGSLASFVASIFNFASFFHRSMEMLHVSRTPDSYLGGDQPHSSSPSPSPAPRHQDEEEEEETGHTTTTSGIGRGSDFLESNFRPATQLRWRRRSYHDTFTAHRRRSYHRSGGPARLAEPPPQRIARWRSQRWSSYEYRRLWHQFR